MEKGERKIGNSKMLVVKLLWATVKWQHSFGVKPLIEIRNEQFYDFPK
jgi:hypothetical protein